MKVLLLSKSLATSQDEEVGCPSISAADVSKVTQFKEWFPMVPLELAVQVPGITQWDVDQLPFKRPLRRKLDQAKPTVIHLFSGEDQQFCIESETNGVVVL